MAPLGHLEPGSPTVDDAEQSSVRHPTQIGTVNSAVVAKCRSQDVRGQGTSCRFDQSGDIECGVQVVADGSMAGPMHGHSLAGGGR
jgi:hypothetical protein